MNAVAEGISRTGIPLGVFDAARTHSSYILPWLWTQAGVMIGAPTYEVSLFPPVGEAIRMAGHKRIRNKRVGYFGSFGWSGGALRGLKAVIEPLKWELSETLEFRGFPAAEDLRKAEAFGEAFANQIKKDFPAAVDPVNTPSCAAR